MTYEERLNAECERFDYVKVALKVHKYAAEDVERLSRELNILERSMDKDRNYKLAVLESQLTSATFIELYCMDLIKRSIPQVAKVNPDTE